MYRIGQLAEKSGVTIRTLHYYDELNLLKPSKITEAGYRYYTHQDVMRLQQISALKKLGFTLSQIKSLLTEQMDLAEEEQWKISLQMQTRAIRKQQKTLASLEKLLTTTLHTIELEGKVNWDAIFTLIRGTTNHQQWKKEYFELHFTQKEQQILNNLPSLDNDCQEITAWITLLKEIRQHTHESPYSEIAQKLANKLMNMALDFFQGDEELLEKYWAIIHSPPEHISLYTLDKDLASFIEKITDIWYENRGKNETIE